MNKKDLNKERKDGPFETYYENGQLESKGTYKDGEYDGTIEWYFESGQFSRKISYKNGVRDGKFTEYEGHPTESGFYSNGKKNGPYRRTIGYYQELREKGIYLNNNKNGFYEEYTVGNQLIEKGIHKNGIKNGPYEQFFIDYLKSEDDKEIKLTIKDKFNFLRERGFYKDGKKDGFYEEFGRNGRLEEKGTYKEGNKYGPYELYDINVLVKERGFYENGKNGPYELYYYTDDGELKLTEKGVFSRGRKYGIYDWIDFKGLTTSGIYSCSNECESFERFYDDGSIKIKGYGYNTRHEYFSKEWVWEEYYENGMLSKRSLFDQNRLVGILDSFYRSGQRRCNRELLNSDNHKNSVLVDKSIFKTFFKNGKLLEKTSYDKIISQGNRYRLYFSKEGEYQKYYPNGILRTLGTYVNDKKNGNWIKYFDDGKVREKISYHDDYKVGPYENYYENGQIKSMGEYKIGFNEHSFRDRITTKYRHLKIGNWVEYFQNGQLKLISNYSIINSFHGVEEHQSSKLDGVFIEYYENGEIKQKGNYKKDKMNGKFEEFYENGELKSQSFYKDDLLNGFVKKYNESGISISKEKYELGVKVNLT